MNNCKTIDNAAYRAINGTDTLNASGHLRRLRDLDLLQMKGSGSRTYYIPGPKFVVSQASSSENAHQPTPDGHQSRSDGHQARQNGHQPQVNGHQSTPTGPLALEGLPETIRQRIPPVGNKPRREVWRGLIQDLCAWRPLSSRELAGILGKQDHKKLVRNHLSPMVADGILAYTIPEMENHPDQRYTTVNQE